MTFTPLLLLLGGITERHLRALVPTSLIAFRRGDTLSHGGVKSGDALITKAAPAPTSIRMINLGTRQRQNSLATLSAAQRLRWQACP
jgi:hypothetical protein